MQAGKGGQDGTANAEAATAHNIGLVAGARAPPAVAKTVEAAAATVALAEATTAARQTANHVGYLVGMQNIVASNGDADAARHFANRCQEQQKLAEELALSSKARVAQAAAEASEAAINQSELGARITECRVLEERAQQELAKISAELVRMHGAFARQQCSSHRLR